MKDFLLILLPLAVVAAKLCGHGGVRSMMAENLVLKQQRIVLRRGRRRAPSLTWSDRLICGFGSLILSAGRIHKVAIAICPSTLLAFHQGLVRRKYRRLFSSTPCPKKPGPKGRDKALTQAIVELTERRPEHAVRYAVRARASEAAHLNQLGRRHVCLRLQQVRNAVDHVVCMREVFVRLRKRKTKTG